MLESLNKASIDLSCLKTLILCRFNMLRGDVLRFLMFLQPSKLSLAMIHQGSAKSNHLN